MASRYASKPVYYRGVYFRAQLEARWAAVFDHFNLRWDYESRQFTLSTGAYTPDFWLSEPDVYVEIKPRYEFADTDRYKELVLQTRCPFLFVAGRPSVGKYLLRYFSASLVGDVGLLLQAQFAEHKHKIWIAQDTCSVALAHDAIPGKSPDGLNINSASIVECLTRANALFT